MSEPPIRSAGVAIRVRTKLTGVSLIYAIGMRKLARALTGKDNLAGLFAWCAKEGVGIDGFHLALIPGGSQGSAWLDARRENGVVCDRVGNVVATVSRGQWSGDVSWQSWLEVLPPTAPAEWGSAAAAAPAKATGAKTTTAKTTAAKTTAAETTTTKAAPAQKRTTLTARVELELSSRAALEKLKPLPREQLDAASKELCGKKGMPALMKWCDTEQQGLARVVVRSGKAVRFEAWLTAPLEDGVFFDAGASEPSGLAISQAEVHASLTKREADVAPLQAAMKKLKAPRAPKWKG